ncbi:hypothetical protein DL766_001344 [Monosporascus sp. MC13-8B]|uniref:DH domain-containing protein n=1 Tax=Monosporascus cannonballus TaxID=155416 RepID=A0ABY0HDU1_9PEZI|nr:hypothetical protein DL763_006252 [Monosporascus cannonballus]RYO91251.1 hypothetical protein DL762_002237 [Monosporascus cannonballus]RYP37856.1 hypothetical protein DL766_001344 [Monosporascus sp. MC13-8B]
MASAVIHNSSQDLSYISRANSKSPSLPKSPPGTCSRSCSVHIPREPSWDAPTPHHPSLRVAGTDPDIDFGTVCLSSADGDDTWKTLDNIAAIGLTLEKEEDDLLSRSTGPLGALCTSEDLSAAGTELTPHTVYVTILASLPASHPELRSSINRNLTDIVELHEEILGDLHRVVPHSEYTQAGRPSTNPIQPNRGHHRWHSLDSVPEAKGESSWLQSVPELTAEPSIAAEVAGVFGKQLEKGAHIQQPIQRICRYPLLFAELLKCTPICDCPRSHVEIESVLIRLRETTAAINRATDNPGTKAGIEKTWLLRDRLACPNYCHTAPFSWKLVFECDHQLYEVIMTACTAKEESEWRARLTHSGLMDPLETAEMAPYGMICLNVKSLGTVFGKPGEESVLRYVDVILEGSDQSVAVAPDDQLPDPSANSLEDGACTP